VERTMISHFWNLCRACPALDVDKLHSEYRSTYRWHEYTPKQQQVVRKPPLPISGTAGLDGSEFSRKKKHPEVAYKSHDFFDPNAVAHGTRASRQAERESSAMQRRSQSEGPVKRNPLFQSEYRLQFASNKKGRERSYDKDEIRPQESKPAVSYPPPAPSSSWNRRQTSLRCRETRDEPVEPREREPKKSISMGQIQPTGNQPTSGQILTGGAAKPNHQLNGSADVDAVDGPDGGPEIGPTTSLTASPARRKEYKSEYKNKFRPFSQYEYVGEGKFFNTSNSPPSEADGPSSLVRLDKMEKIEKLEGEPWYKEVQELRKVANDYKCRGWGTDLVPPHMSQIYTQQLNLHEQAAKRESLSALALAISTPRSLNKEEKERENQRKLSPAPHAPLRLARPKTAPSKAKKSASRPESAQASPITRTDKTEKENLVPAGEAAKKGISRASSKGASRDTSRPPSAIENHMDYFREPVVKSPPEPTRVKSPEQLLMRSPDPINWTVPLDTGKTFSVTQSVRDSDSARNSPMSDHSSHFDSVSGTAINLGLHSVNEKGSLHYPKVSALAREAKELQGKSSHTKDENTNQGRVFVNGKDTKDSVEADTTKLNGTNEPPLTKVPAHPTNTTKPASAIPVSKGPAAVTNIKCLDDPSFSFDAPAKVSNSASGLPALAQPRPVKAEPEKGQANKNDNTNTTAAAPAATSATANTAAAPAADEKASTGSTPPDNNSTNATPAPNKAVTTAPPRDTEPASAPPQPTPTKSPTAAAAAVGAKATDAAATTATGAEPAPTPAASTAAATASRPSGGASTTPSSIPVPVSSCKTGPSAGGSTSMTAPSTSPAAPSHTMSSSTSSSFPSSIPVPINQSPAPKKPSYRVLEDPDLDLSKPMGTPYKVLEDPGMMTASIYHPSTDGKGGAGNI